ncbi:MAG: serine O-acetyltransferase [Chloroflexi bacterium]|nr:serine O-acetyltransferase [Chloroflexota bacterium]
MFHMIREDIHTVFDKDPAARTTWEVITCYPGLHALWLHRIAHALWKRRLHFLGRLVSQFARWLTGIEIHPGATIGRRCFIDHGMGVVVGETAEIGDDVLMYQGVVLGGTSLEKKKRHPTIGSNVIIGAGAIVLGPIEVGDSSRVGAGSVVIKPVPPGTTVVGVPGHVADRSRESRHEPALEHARLPDPVLRTLSETLASQGRLEERIADLERTLAELRPGLHPVDTHRLPAHCEERIREALRQVIEPEVGANVVDLGLIRGIMLNGNGIEIQMSLTYPGCPHAEYLLEQVQRKAHSVTGDEPVEVVLVT